MANVFEFVGKAVSNNPKTAAVVAVFGTLLLFMTKTKNDARSAMGGGPMGSPKGKPDNINNMEGGK